MGREELGRGRLGRRREGDDGSTRLWTRRDRVGIGDDAASQSASTPSGHRDYLFTVRNWLLSIRIQRLGHLLKLKQKLPVIREKKVRILWFWMLLSHCTNILRHLTLIDHSYRHLHLTRWIRLHLYHSKQQYKVQKKKTLKEGLPAVHNFDA